MSPQNYRNHRRLVPMFHVVLFGILVLTLIGSCVNLYQSWGDHNRFYSAALIAVLCVAALMLFAFARQFPLKAQDRAIRAEESLRHYILTGKPIDPRLTVMQIIALRFASDGEVAALARRAAEQQMAPDAIKQAIRNWRADTHRV